VTTQSVLDQMTAGIMQRKNATLTPVAGEIEAAPPTISDVKGDVFPFDAGIDEQIEHSARIIRAELARIEECLRSIERAANLPEGGIPVTTFVPKSEQIRLATRADEAESERKYTESEQFQRDFEEKQRKAQEQALASLDADTPVPEEPLPNADGGWACPEHGSAFIITLVSKKGRTYRTCKHCEEFER
jgi:hypothetical protein